MLLTQVKRIKVFHRGIKSHTEEREGKVEDKKMLSFALRFFI